jgi:hypothetical protein
MKIIQEAPEKPAKGKFTKGETAAKKTTKATKKSFAAKTFMAMGRNSFSSKYFS